MSLESSEKPTKSMMRLSDHRFVFAFVFFVLLLLFPLSSDTQENMMYLGGAQVRKMRGSANHHANPQEKCSQMEAPDGNNKRNTHNCFIFVFGLAVGRKIFRGVGL
jgi:hypothetical protein